MKIIITFATLVGALTINAQSRITGDLKNDKRSIENNISYTIKYTKAGSVAVDITVNIDGKVASAVINNEQTDIVSTPLEIQAINRAKELHFGRCYHCPKFHKGSVFFKIKKKKESDGS